MKKLLTILFVLSFIVSYAKPLTFYTLRYKGKVLDVHRSESYSFIDFKFDKSEVSNEDLLNSISKGGFYLSNSKVTFSYRSYNDEKLPSGFTVTIETYDIK
jgi:hypothetical protein